jgi:hypothetical protein
MLRPKVVLLIFVSGKIVLTGAKVREEIYSAFNQIYSVLVGEWWLRPNVSGDAMADNGSSRSIRVQEGLSSNLRKPLSLHHLFVTNTNVPCSLHIL